jgi:putative ABC transport system permease protein
MRVITSNGEEQGRMLAVDRTDFGQVAWFRRDFARESLGGLMNELAVAPENILVTQQFLNDHQAHLGDKVNIQVKLADAVSYRGTFTIAGIYRYFPTVQPEEMTVIANLDYLFAEAGSDFLHHIWLRMAPGADGQALLDAVRGQGIEPARVRDTNATLAIEQAKLERVGIFGTLSVGFLAASVMAVLALLVHSYASLQERLYQFGVMRAMGLLHRQVVGQVVLLVTGDGAEYGCQVKRIKEQGGRLWVWSDNPAYPAKAIDERMRPVAKLVRVILQDQLGGASAG